MIKAFPLVDRVYPKIKKHFFKLKHGEFDIYFEPVFIPNETISAKYAITTIHDFSFYLFPEWHEEKILRYYQKYFWRNIYKSNAIIAVSKFTKKQILEFLKIPSEKVRVIYNGYDNNVLKVYRKEELLKLQRKMGLPPKFILFVGAIQPRKNLEALLQAYSMLGDSFRRTYKLVIVSSTGWKNEKIFSLLRKLQNNVYFLKGVSYKELAIVYNLATCLVYPSFYEGFGLPPLEAMACGCPVIVSQVTAMPEVCGKAAYYINPYDVESIKEGIWRVSTDENLRRQMAQLGLENARKFSWKKSAKEHLKLFKEILR